MLEFVQQQGQPLIKDEKAKSRPVFKKKYRLCFGFVIRKMPETSYMKISPVWNEDGPRKDDDIFVINFEKICKSMGMAVLVTFFVVSVLTMTPRTIAAHEFTRDPKGK